MSDFYTVTIQRLQLISTFDENGKKTGDRVEKIPVVHCDLPYSTALMYQQKAADPSEVTLVRQVREFAPGRSARKVSDYVEGVARFSHRPETKGIKDIGSEDFTVSREEKKLADAALSGDMGAAITAELEEAS